MYSHTQHKDYLKKKTTQKLSSLPVKKGRELTRVATLVDVFCHIRSSQLTPAKRLYLLLMFNIEPKECLFIRPLCENVFSYRHLLSLHMHSNYFFLERFYVLYNVTLFIILDAYYHNVSVY